MILLAGSMVLACTSSRQGQGTLQGSYTGLLPCNGCEGMLTRLDIFPGNQYRLLSGRLGQDQTEKDSGTYTLQGDHLVLKGGSMEYRVSGNRLLRLQGTGPMDSSFNLQLLGTTAVNTYWTPVELAGKAVPENPRRKKPFLLLRSGDGRVLGNGSCNGFGGSFTIGESGTLRFSPLAATKMFCEGVMQTEGAFLAALAATENYRFSGDTLVLGGGGKTLAKLLSSFSDQ